MKIIEAYGEDVAVVYKHNPLDFHKEAFLAAEASLAANDQGKFWEYHDLLFANMKALQREKLEEYAQQLGLDMVAFNSALDLGVFKEQVARDIKLAKSIGIKGAPNTVVNGRQVSGAVPFEDFKKIIDEEIKKAKKKIAGGVSRAEVYNATIARGKIQTDFEEKVNYFSYEGSPAIGDPATAKIVITEFSEFQ